MKNKILFSIIIIFLISLFSIFYVGLNKTSIYKPKTSLNKNIPFFKAKIYETNNEISSNEIFNGNNYYLVNIWSSWCVPCRDEHTFLMKLKKNKKIEIIGLNYKDKQKNAKEFLKELNNPYKKILLDQDGTIAIEWGAYGVPESFLIYDKKIIRKFIGPLDTNSLIEINNLIK